MRSNQMQRAGAATRRSTLVALGLLVGPAWSRRALAQDDAGQDCASSGANLFPNSQWQLTTALGPGWNGQPGSLQQHLDSFEREVLWDLSGTAPDIGVTGLSVIGVPSQGRGAVQAMSRDPIPLIYPGALVTFDEQAHPSLRAAPMRVRSVDYRARSFVVVPPRGALPAPGPVHCHCRQVSRCDRGGVTGHGPDGWSKDVAAHLWIDRWPRLEQGSVGAGTGWRSNLRPSMKRCVVFVPQSARESCFFHTIDDFTTLRGRTVTFGMWIERVTGGRGRLFVDDGAVAYSDRVIEDRGWAWLEMRHTVSEAAERVNLGFVAEGAGMGWRIAEPRLDYGGELGVGAYVRPKGRLERFVVKITPDSFFGADFAFPDSGGVTVDLAGETGMAITDDVPLVWGQLEGTPSRTDLPLFTRNAPAPPHRFGAAIHGGAAGSPVAGSAVFDLAADGTMWLYSAPGAAWRDVSLDLDQATLW